MEATNLARDCLDEPVTPPHADFEALFSGQAARVTRLARLLGAQDPEDVAAEAFCKLLAAWPRLDHARLDVVPYLNRIVVNEVRDRHRRRSLARDRAHLVAVPSPAPGADGTRVAVLAALAALPHRQREALVLRYWLDLPVAQIADAMGVRVGTAKSLVSRGLDSLEARLTEEEER